jgi:hypothetical protein
MEFLASKTFNLVIKVTSTDFGTRLKVFIMVFLALNTFDLVKIIYKSVDLVPKNCTN